jgi:hypothetical protein
LANLQIDADLVPNLAYHFDADPDPYFHLMLMRIWILSDADPDAEPGYQHDADPDADPDPQHWSTFLLFTTHCSKEHGDTIKRL